MKSIEQQIKSILAKSETDEEGVKEITSAIVGLQKSGLKMRRPFPIGIPFPDGIGVKIVCEKSHIKELMKLTESSRFNGMEFFPYGIINPEFFSGSIQFQ